MVVLHPISCLLSSHLLKDVIYFLIYLYDELKENLQHLNLFKCFISLTKIIKMLTKIITLLNLYRILKTNSTFEVTHLVVIMCASRDKLF